MFPPVLVNKAQPSTSREPGGQEDASGHGGSSGSSPLVEKGWQLDGMLQYKWPELKNENKWQRNGICLVLMPTNHRAECNRHGGMIYERLEKPMLSGFVSPKCGHLKSFNLHASIWSISDPW